MNKETGEKMERWIDYFLLGLLAFGGLGLELILKIIEDVISKNSINYIIHWILICIIWGIFVFTLIKHSKKSKILMSFMYKSKAGFKDIIISTVILLAVVVFSNALFWEGFKPAQEFKNLGVSKFIFQYVYYLFEIVLVVLIIAFGQKAGELLFKNTFVPWGGIFLGLTWGIVHSFTQNFSTGIVLLFASVLFGSVYILLRKNIFYTYLFIFLMFVL